MRTGVWLTALAAISASVVLAHVLHPGGGIPPRFRELFDVAHVVGFAAITWIIMAHALKIAAARRLSARAVIGAVLVFACLLAVVSEGAQMLVDREADIADVLRDLGGITGGALLCISGRLVFRMRSVLIAVACAVLVVSMWRPGRVVVAVANAQLRLPVLMGFESALDEQLYVGYQTRIFRRDVTDDWPLGGYLAEVEPDRDGFAGISFPRLMSDWTGYTHISFLIAAREARSGHAVIRIHDRGHSNRYEDRFNREFAIDGKPRRIRIALEDVANAPVGRKLDLSRIEEVIVFVIAPETGAFRIDDLRLE